MKVFSKFRHFVKRIYFNSQAFDSQNIYIRQAVALSLTKIPIELKTAYESLLLDDSYFTKEIALYNLWTQFPENRSKYLEETKDLIGFQDKNIKQLWLALAYITPGYSVDEKPEFSANLIAFTSDIYSFEIREKAFSYINELGLWNKSSISSLVDACVHPAWRFSKSSRLLLDVLLQDNHFKMLFTDLNGVSSEGLVYLNKKLQK